MKRIKISLTTLLCTAFLVGTFSFTNKPTILITYTYSPATSGRDVRTSTDPNAIIASELIADALPGDGELDNWGNNIISHHLPGEHLLGIEFNTTSVADMEAAGTIVYNIYTSTGTLPNDGQTVNNIKFFLKQ